MGAERAREIINGLLSEGRELATLTATSMDAVEQFEAKADRWSSKGREHLRHMWDQDNDAELFAMANLYGRRTDYRRWEVDQDSLRRQIRDLEKQLDKVDIASTSPEWKPAQPEGEPTLEQRNVFHIQNVGSLTIADKVRDIKGSVHNVTGSSAEDIQKLTAAFADALSRDSSITDEDREDALDQLKVVADEAATPGTHRRGILRAAVAQLGLLAKASSSLQQLYDQWHPVVQGLLPPQG